MPSALPDGEPVPAGGVLPDGVQVRSPFGVYVHVPFCATRCGYCDFNTYTSLGHLQSGWADAAVAEVRLARQVLGTHRHAWTVPGASLLAVIALVGGQLVLEQVFGFATSLSIVVNFVGGIVFIALLTRESRL